jgi:hypothetical protein
MALFADFFTDGFFGLILLVSLGGLGFRKLFKSFDNDGKVKEAAKDGVIGILKRILK